MLAHIHCFRLIKLKTIGWWYSFFPKINRHRKKIVKVFQIPKLKFRKTKAETYFKWLQNGSKKAQIARRATNHGGGPPDAPRAFLVVNRRGVPTFFKNPNFFSSYTVFTYTAGKLIFRTSTKNELRSVTFKLGPLETKEKKTWIF